MKKKIAAVFLAMTLMANQAAVFAEAPKISTEQKAAIIDHCDEIRENLRNVQHQDSRARVYYGRYYETIFSKFIVPMNMRLTENNLLSDNLLSSQTKFTNFRADFSSDYVDYQRSLEELVAVNCKEEPEKFYELLQTVREKRENVNQDAVDLRKTVETHIELVTDLEKEL